MLLDPTRRSDALRELILEQFAFEIESPNVWMIQNDTNIWKATLDSAIGNSSVNTKIKYCNQELFILLFTVNFVQHCLQTVILLQTEYY